MGMGKITAENTVQLVRSFRRITTSDRDQYRLKGANERIRYCAAQAAGVLEDRSLVFRVQVRLRPKEEPSHALYLITTLPLVTQPVRLSNLFGKQLLYRYGLGGFYLPKLTKLSVLYDFFGGILSAARIDPDAYESAGIKFFTNFFGFFK